MRAAQDDAQADERGPPPTTDQKARQHKPNPARHERAEESPERRQQLSHAGGQEAELKLQADVLRAKHLQGVKLDEWFRRAQLRSLGDAIHRAAERRLPGSQASDRAEEAVDPTAGEPPAEEARRAENGQTKRWLREGPEVHGAEEACIEANFSVTRQDAEQARDIVAKHVPRQAAASGGHGRRLLV